MNKNIKPEYDCGRVILKPISVDDAPEIFKYFNERITKFMYPKSPDRVEDTIDYLEKAVQKNKRGENYEVAIFYKCSEGLDFAGGGGIHDINTKTPEFGIWIRQDYHGLGLGYETIHALKDWADKYLDYDYIKYPVDRENKPSRGIPESLDGVIEDEYKMTAESGKELNVVEYRIYRGSEKS